MITNKKTHAIKWSSTVLTQVAANGEEQQWQVQKMAIQARHGYFWCYTEVRVAQVLFIGQEWVVNVVFGCVHGKTIDSSGI